MSEPIRKLDFRTFGVSQSVLPTEDDGSARGALPDDREGTRSEGLNGLFDPTHRALLDETAAHLHAGGVIGYPTETVYGFGSALTPDGLERLRRLKQRPDGKPVLALVPNVDAVAELGWNDAARELAYAFWPGAVTLILPDPAGLFPPGVRGEDGTVAIRQTSHPIAAALVARLGGPLTSTSANLPGQSPAVDASGVIDTLQNSGTAGQGVWVIDAGRLPESAPSTLIDCTGPTPRVVRSGATPSDRIRCVIPDLLDVSTDV